MPRPSIWLAEAASGFNTRRIAMLTKFILALALALAVISAIPLSVGRTFAQSNPTLDCTPSYGGASTC
jgi:hypothetical protein